MMMDHLPYTGFPPIDVRDAMIDGDRGQFGHVLVNALFLPETAGYLRGISPSSTGRCRVRPYCLPDSFSQWE